MTLAEWHSTLFQFIGIVLSFLALVASIIAVILTYKNLSEMKKQLCSNKSNISIRIVVILYFMFKKV